MQRKVLLELKQWVRSENRKPLILRGARQVGKTWLVRELAKQSDMQLIELNFEYHQQLKYHFTDNDPKEILLNLQSALNITIDPQKSILFLDEIQAAPELIAKLRWFYELMPTLAVVAAGSLLEFALAEQQFSMPVGRINYCFIEPFGFEEFLLALKEEHLLNAINQFNIEKPFNELIHDKANRLFKEFLIVGGMPEAVNCWQQYKSFDALSKVHYDLINTYKDDFAKYASKATLAYLDETLNSFPKMLTKKIILRQINKTAKHINLKQSVELLSKAKLCHPVISSYANSIPLGAEINPKIFKMILIDVGLVGAMLGLRLYQFKSIEEIMLINKGAISEQIVGQLLRLLPPSYIEPKLFYWVREAQSSSAEVDYLLQFNEKIIPIEVKSGSEGKLRSLHQFVAEKKYHFAIRIYGGNISRQIIDVKTPTGQNVKYHLLSLPFYLTEQLLRLLPED